MNNFILVSRERDAGILTGILQNFHYGKTAVQLYLFLGMIISIDEFHVFRFILQLPFRICSMDPIMHGQESVFSLQDRIAGRNTVLSSGQYSLELSIVHDDAAGINALEAFVGHMTGKLRCSEESCHKMNIIDIEIIETSHPEHLGSNSVASSPLLYWE